MKWLVAVMLTCLMCVYASTGMAVCQGNFGTPIGSFRAVDARSNGTCTGTGDGTWQCVEYVRRFYLTATDAHTTMNKTLGTLSTGFASAAYSDWAQNSNMTQYQNGVTTTLPAPGDIYCLSGSTYGHVGTMKSVDLEAMQVEIIDQNRSSSNPILVRSLHRDAQGRISVDPLSGYVTQGWLRDLTYPDQLFTAVVQRNGGAATVGSPTGPAYDYGPYRRRDYAGGSFGNCCILYDPNNQAGNPLATNEAYLLRTGLYEYYFAHGGWSAFGCPSRDEYVTGDGTNAIQFFVRHVWLPDKQKYETQQHYMYWDPTPPPGEGTVTWHSTYASDWVTQSPFVITLQPGQTATFSVTYKNMGTTSWLGAGTPSSNVDYVELRACSPWPNGDVQNGWVYPGSGWISASRVCTASQASIAPGQNATFTFTVKVPDNQPVGNDQRAYFRPWHATGGLIEEWDGYYVQINVVSPPSPPAGSLKPLAGDFNGGGMADVCLFAPSTGQWFVATSTGSSFVPASTIWLQNWGTNAGGYQPFTGDFNGDGKTDVGVYDPASGGWFVATSNGSSFVPAPTAWLGNWGIDPTFKALAGDFTGDGKTDVGLYHPASGGWFVAVSNGSSFTPSATAWLGPWGANATAYRPIVGWFNSGPFCDVGLFEPAYGQWYVATSNGSSFTPSPSGWLGAWGASTTLQNLTADFNGGGLSDVCVYDPASGGWSVATSGGSSFTGSPSAWLYPWGADVTFKALAADFTGDGKADVALYHPSSGGWFEATSTGSAFTPSAYAWLGSWGVGGTSARYAPPEDDGPPTPPLAFRLWMATNPTHRDGQILFTLPSPERVRIAVYDVRGREVGVVSEQDYSAGQHTVSLTEAAKASPLSNGVYFVRLTSALRTATTKLALIN